MQTCYGDGWQHALQRGPFRINPFWKLSFLHWCCLYPHIDESYCNIVHGSPAVWQMVIGWSQLEWPDMHPRHVISTLPQLIHIQIGRSYLSTFKLELWWSASWMPSECWAHAMARVKTLSPHYPMYGPSYPFGLCPVAIHRLVMYSVNNQVAEAIHKLNWRCVLVTGRKIFRSQLMLPAGFTPVIWHLSGSDSLSDVRALDLICTILGPRILGPRAGVGSVTHSIIGNASLARFHYMKLLAYDKSASVISVYSLKAILAMRQTLSFVWQSSLTGVSVLYSTIYVLRLADTLDGQVKLLFARWPSHKFCMTEV